MPVIADALPAPYRGLPRPLGAASRPAPKGMSAREDELELGERRVRISRPEKVLWPATWRSG